MLEFLRSIPEGNSIQIPLEFHQDLNWFLQFLKKFNGVTFFDVRPYKMEIELDACLPGVGAKCGSQVYASQLPPEFGDFNIVHLEMLNILVALRVWRDQWSNQKI